MFFALEARHPECNDGSPESSTVPISEIPRCTRDDVPYTQDDVPNTQDDVPNCTIAARHPECVFLREGSPECCTILSKWRSLVALGMTYLALGMTYLALGMTYQRLGMTCLGLRLTYLGKLRNYLIALFSRIATAGNVFPSRNSRKAPPPVEIYDI